MCHHCKSAQFPPDLLPAVSPVTRASVSGSGRMLKPGSGESKPDAAQEWQAAALAVWHLGRVRPLAGRTESAAAPRWRPLAAAAGKPGWGEPPE